MSHLSTVKTKLMNKLLLHIERLRRHYEHSIHTYDLISLLDLSHSLRMWVDLKSTLPSINPKFNSSLSFKTEHPARKVVKEVALSEYVFCYMPEGTITHASNGELVAKVSGDETAKYSAGGRFMRNEDDSIIIDYLFYSTKLLDPKFGHALEHGRVSRCNFAVWLSSEAVRYRFKDENNNFVKSSISREMLIKRIANAMDGSHPSIASQESDANRFDEHIEFLMKFKCGGLPLPYFILLHSAQTILSKITPKVPV